MFFRIKDGKVIENSNHALGMVPIIEYPLNNSRLGAFEPVIPILDAINTVTSNRLDGVEQFVQSLMKFINCEIDHDTFAALQQQGAISIKSADGQKADVEIMTSELNQQQTQTLVDHMYQTVLTICGMPNRNGNGSSTSDTGAASLLRDGWTLAEARAKDAELMFKASEQETLKVVLRICRDLSDISLSLRDIDIKFTRRNYENIQTKAQVLCEMLNNPKIDPKLAFTHCGLFTDPEEAYAMSMKWFEENKDITEPEETTPDETKVEPVV
jgi:SPP1 family phage portal protein